MTSQPKKAGRKMDEPQSEKESDAVRVDTASATTEETDAPVEEATAAVEDEATASEDADDVSESDTVTESESPGETQSDHVDDESKPAKPRFSISLPRLVAFGVLPCVVLLLAGAAGYLKWQSTSIRASQVSSVESVAVARDATVAMLSYKPDTVEKDLDAARGRLTGTFQDSYTHLTHDVVIPGAKQRHISATATVPAAASVSATANHAVVLVLVNQTVVMGNDPPTATASSVRVTLDKVGDRWLISGFDPV